MREIEIERERESGPRLQKLKGLEKGKRGEDRNRKQKRTIHSRLRL